MLEVISVADIHKILWEILVCFPAVLSSDTTKQILCSKYKHLLSLNQKDDLLQSICNLSNLHPPNLSNLYLLKNSERLQLKDNFSESWKSRLGTYKWHHENGSIFWFSFSGTWTPLNVTTVFKKIEKQNGTNICYWR